MDLTPRVLCIDDEEVIRETIQTYLTDSGFVVLAAADGREGLDAFRRESPDAVLVDLRMPEVDGLDVLAAVVRESPETPVIVVSGTGSLTDVVEALRRGAWDFVTKPIEDLAILELALQGALERARLLRDNRRYRENLEEEVKKRTIELEEEIERRIDVEADLRRAKEAAESAGKVKSEFLATVSHELRTPLSGIMGMIHLARADSVDSVQQGYLDGAMASAKNLLGVVSDVLDIAGIEAGLQVVERQDFDLAQEIAAVSAPAAAAADIKGLALVREIAPGTPNKLVGDPGRLRQILVKLLDNAVKFTERGEIRLHVAPVVHSATPDRIRLVFTVSDTGIGIARDKLDAVFETFTQADGSYARKYQGMGLGLAIVKRLVETMGGAVAVQSVPGVGTTLNFDLGFELRRASPDENRAAKPRPAEEAGRAASILLAEDNAITQLAVKNFLLGKGYNVTAVGDGRQALEALDRAPFDAVLMDIQMPKLDGIETTSLIRDPGSPHFNQRIPIIALSAYTSSEDRQRFSDAGMDDYLAKPFEFEELLLILKKHVIPAETLGDGNL